MTNNLKRTRGVTDAAKLRFLLDCGTRGAAHSGESLFDHLVATRDLLRRWGAPEFVCDAGLFHSIYGSRSYRLDLAEVRREDVQRLLGRDAERLVHLYSRCGGRLLELLSGGEAPADGVESAVDEDDLRWLAHIVVANEVEQAGRGWAAELATDPRIARWLLPTAKAQIRPLLDDMRAAFAKAGRVLTWAESLEFVDQVALSYRSTAAEYLDAEIARLADERPGVFSAWHTLPPALKEQLVTAPATCRIAEADIHGSARLREFLIQSITALSLKLDPSAESTSPLWTPDGSFYFPVRRKGTEPTPPVRFDTARPYQAVRFGRVTIDLFSPFAGDHLDGISATDGAHSAEEAETVLQRVELALHLLYDTSWQAATFVDLSLVSLVLRRDASTPTEVWSGSWPKMIGKAVLVNQHLASWTPAAMADSILHEAIHAFLYRLERMASIFIEPPPRGLTVLSPWTGADLAPSSFSHACLVWFGLWCFWRRARRQASAPADDAQRLLTRAAQGFLGPPLGKCGLSSYWTPGFAALVEWCQRQVESGS